jgi:hypothetical protein
VLSEYRDRREKTKMVPKFWEIAGSKMGDVIV